MASTSEDSFATTGGVKDPFARLSGAQLAGARKSCAHVYGRAGYRCRTDGVGYATPENRGPATLVLEATEGFIPLWASGTVLRWRFQDASLSHFANKTAAKAAIRTLMSDALLLWGDAVPVKFVERRDAWDFEVVVRESDDCDTTGCVLASAFFPDPGRHELVIYPKTFGEPKKEQIETLAHEFGHVFGLRHFFAQVQEKRWRSELFGKHSPFSIMNYGPKSKMTADDRKDLKTLYRKVWAGDLDEINGTEIRLVRPFHTLGTRARAAATA